MIADAPVGYWPLDETAGATTFADLVGSHNGVLDAGDGQAVFGSTGVLPVAGDDTSCTFSGATRGLRVLSVGSLIDNTGDHGQSLELWLAVDAYPDPPGDGSYSFQHFTAFANAGNTEFDRGGTDGLAWSAFCSAAAGPGSDSVGATPPLAVTNDGGVAHHVVYTRGGGYQRVYIDGVMVGLASIAYSQPTNLLLGYHPTVGFVGRLAHVALYNHELTPQAVLTHRFAGVVGLPDTPEEIMAAVAFGTFWNGAYEFWRRNPYGAEARKIAMDAVAAVAGIGFVDSIAPVGGPAAGGTAVVITGTGFDVATGVKFGTTDATAVVAWSKYELHCIAPAHAAGAVDVTVVVPGTDIVATAAYTYA